MARIAERFLTFEVSKDSLSWTRFCGSLAVVLTLLLFLSGTFMAFYYTPVPGTAYDSVDFALFNLPFGIIKKVFTIIHGTFCLLSWVSIFSDPWSLAVTKRLGR